MTSADRPIDLSDQIGAWLRTSLSLAETARIQGMVTELKKLATRQETPGFQLAFVGEFSRGKSTLINRLLERSLLPVGTLPTTATITSIVSGSEEQMEVFFADGHQERRPLEENVWDDLLADDHPEQAQKVIGRVRLTVNDAWLQELDAEFVDTPGINDLTGYRATLVSEILSESDAAVLLVSAVFPLSLTEAAFLEQEVIGKQIPQIIAVVSMLDTLPQSQQAEVFKVASERIAHISPLIQVYPEYPINEEMTEDEALDAVRDQIATMVSQSDRRTWRSRQIAAILTRYLGQLKQLGRAALDTARMDEAARDEALRQAQEETQLAELHWERIAQDFEQRRLQLDSMLREQLHGIQNTLIEAATVDMNKAPDPKVWWERDFPLRMRRAFLNVARDCETWLLAALAKDMQWLQVEVGREFGFKLGLQTPVSDARAEIALNARDIELVDIDRQRLFVRLGTSAAAIVGYILFAPIGGAVSVVNDLLNIGGAVIGNEAVNLAASPFFRKKEEKQRRLLGGEIRRTVQRGAEEYVMRVSTRLRDLYNQVLQDMRREQTVWLNARKHALEAGERISTDVPWQQLLDDVAKLRSEIQAALEK